MNWAFVIPNYNGGRLLEKCLDGLPGHVCVVDDASTDNSLKILGNALGHVRVIARKANGGFSAAVNDGIHATESDLVVLLNTDVEVQPGFLDSVLPLFDDPDVFAVSPRIIVPGLGNLDEGAKTGFWRHGMFYTDQRQGLSGVTPILYTSGCAAVYRRSMLLELGGFDEVYSPFYWEDCDLGYRAWKRGWKSLYQPAGVVNHQHAASISKMNARYVSRVRARNGLLFVWRNIDDPRLISRHKRWLPLVLSRRAAAGDLSFINGWKDAYAHRKQAVQARLRDSRRRVMSDGEILAQTCAGTDQ